MIFFCSEASDNRVLFSSFFRVCNPGEIEGKAFIAHMELLWSSSYYPSLDEPTNDHEDPQVHNLENEESPEVNSRKQRSLET